MVMTFSRLCQNCGTGQKGIYEASEVFSPRVKKHIKTRELVAWKCLNPECMKVEWIEKKARPSA